MTGMLLDHETIAMLARELAAAQERLAQAVEPVREEQRRIVRRRGRAIRNRTAELAVARDALHDAIAQNGPLFKKPRTRSQHGVRYGLRKQPGKIEGDREAMIGRIRGLMPERAPELLNVKTTVNAAALKQLGVSDLARIGAAIAVTGDKVVIAVTGEDDLDRYVQMVLDDLAHDEEVT